jgi:hypothetical protein
MAMRTKFAAWIMNSRIFSCSGRVSFHAPNQQKCRKFKLTALHKSIRLVRLSLYLLSLESYLLYRLCYMSSPLDQKSFENAFLSAPISVYWLASIHILFTYNSVFTPPSSMFIVRVHVCIILTCIQINGITVVTKLRMLFALGLNYIDSRNGCHSRYIIVCTSRYVYRARICKRLRCPGIDSKESIPQSFCSLAGRYVK